MSEKVYKNYLLGEKLKLQQTIDNALKEIQSIKELITNSPDYTDNEITLMLMVLNKVEEKLK